MANVNNREDLTEVQMITKIVGWSVFAILVLITFFGSWYTVQAGQRGIVLTMGNPSEIPSSEGLHFKVPLVQTIVKMDIQTQKYEADASAASKDLQTVATKIAVNYHLTGDVVPRLYKEIGVDCREKIIQPAVQEIVKSCTAKFTAEELITQRANVKDCIDIGLKQRLLDKGITMETTSITNFDFSTQFNTAIEQKVTAEQNALTQKNKLAQVEYEAQQLVATANGTATILNAQAEAKKVQLINDQLAQSPQYVEYIKVQRWDGKLPVYMMGGTVPLMQIPNLNSTQ